MTAHDKAAALHLSVAVGAVDAILQIETSQVRQRRLEQLIRDINRVIDIYRLQSFRFEDLENAARIIESVNGMIEGMYREDV